MREGPFATECVAVGSCRLYTAKSEYQVMKFVVTITQDEDGMFIAECPSITGCVSQGRTAEEAQMNVQDAIRECLEVRGGERTAADGNDAAGGSACLPPVPQRCRSRTIGRLHVARSVA